MSLYYTNIILVIFYFLYIDKFWFYSLNYLPHKDIFRDILQMHNCTMIPTLPWPQRWDCAFVFLEILVTVYVWNKVDTDSLQTHCFFIMLIRMYLVYWGIIIPRETNFWEVYRNQPVPLPVQLSCKCNSSLTDQPILMKLYTVTVFDMRICRKEDNPGPNYFKGDN